MLANLPSSPATPAKPTRSDTSTKRTRTLATRMLEKIKVRPPSSDRPRRMSGYQIARSHMYQSGLSPPRSRAHSSRGKCDCSICWGYFKLVLAFPIVLLIWLIQQALNIIEGILEILKSVVLCPFARRYVAKTKLSLNQLNRIYRGQKPLLLVLDLDGTLIESTVERPSFRDSSYFEMHLSSFAKQTIYVYRRPGLQEFLATVSSFCEVWVYTASEKEYADQILNNIDLNGLITKRFYRDSCLKIKNFQSPSGHSVTYHKALSQLRVANPHNTLIVDDNPSIFLNGQENLVPVKKWSRFNRQDTALKETLQTICQVAKSGQDARVALSNIRYSE